MKKFFLSIATFFVAFLAVAQTPLPVDTAVRIGKLDNGLTYYIRHNSQPAQRAEFYLATNVGAFQETDDQDGLAHFLEHMCFNGTKNFPGKELLNYLQNIGAEFGRNINASTGFERTTYMLNNIPVVREGIIDSCLLVMHDYSHFVNCDQEEIDSERGVILEERRARRNANWRMFEKSLPILFQGTPYVNRTLIGGEEQLKTFKRESLVNFYQTWYKPDMQALIVVGDIDVDQIEAKIKSTFADIEKPATPTVKVNHKVADNEKPIVAIITDPEAVTSSFEIMWKSDADPIELNGTAEGYFMDMIEAYVTLIMNERFEEIASKPDAPFIGASFGFSSLCNSTDVVNGSVRFKDGEGIKALKTLAIEIEKMKRFGFTDAEVERAKTNIISSLEKDVEAAPTRKNDDFIDAILENFFFKKYLLDPAVELQIANAICGQISAAMLNQIVPQAVTDENMLVIFNGPEKEGLVNPTEQEVLNVLAEVKDADIEANVEEVSNEPLLDPTTLQGATSSDMKQGQFGATEWMLSNGVKVVVLPTQHKKNEVLVRLVKKGGRSLIETADLASFDDNLWALYLSNKGVSKFSNTQLKKMLTGKQVSCDPQIGDFNHGIVAESTPKDLETAFQLVYLNFADQRFSEDEYQIGVNNISAILPNLATNPQFQLMKLLNDNMYNNNPRKETINEEIIKNANIATIERVYKALYNGADGATLYVVGNVTVDDVKPLIEKYIGSIPKGGAATNWIDRHEDAVKGNVSKKELISMTTPKSTVVQVYSADIPYTVKGEVLLDMSKYVLDMVYVATLRESEGGTYSPQTMIEFENLPSGKAYLYVIFETNTDQEQSLVKMAKDELNKLAKNGMTDEQFTRTIENFKKNIPENRISNRYWMRNLTRWNNFNINYDSDYEAAVNGATKEEIISFLNSVLKQGNAFELIIAPKDK